MALHEIGYLIIGGAFQCWFWSGPDNPCPNSEMIMPAGISREKASDVESREVHYEESGFAVFDRKDDALELRKKSGEKLRLRLSELNRETKKALPKTLAAEERESSLWRYESLEEIIKSAMISHEPNSIDLLRKDDLKTPLVISKEILDSLRQRRIDKLLNDSQMPLPMGFIRAAMPCTYKKINATATTGLCAPPVKATAYSKPDKNSEKVLEASFLWAHLEGRPVRTMEVNPAESIDELLVFEEKGEWLRMKLVVLEKSKRIVWFHKNDIPYKLVRLNQTDRMKTLIEFLNPTGAMASSDEYRTLAEDLKKLMEEPFDFDFDSAEKTKWSDGILWVKVNVRSQPHCSSEEAETIATGWLPYIDPKSKKKILGWHSRGC